MGEVTDPDDPPSVPFGRLGALLLNAGLSVTEVRETLEAVQARVEPEPRWVFSVLPQIVIASSRATERSYVTAVEGTELSFGQARDACRLAALTAAGTVGVADLSARIREIEARPRTFRGWWTAAGGALISVGLTVVFAAPWWAVAIPGLVGALVGAATYLMGKRRGAAAVAPFIVAVISTLLVGWAAVGLDLGVVPLIAVCAPIAILVPGATITNALLELTATDILTGSARLMFGIVVLVLMAFGVQTAAALLPPDIAASAADGAAATSGGFWQAVPPPWTAWLGVVSLALGVGAAFGSDLRLALFSAAVMLAAYAVLTATTSWVGGPMAAGLTAAGVFVGARLIELVPGAPPAQITFQPAFLLLVPGTVGLVALAAEDPTGLSTAVSTFLSLCIGIKIGALLTPGPTRRNPTT